MPPLIPPDEETAGTPPAGDTPSPSPPPSPDPAPDAAADDGGRILRMPTNTEPPAPPTTKPTTRAFRPTAGPLAPPTATVGAVRQTGPSRIAIARKGEDPTAEGTKKPKRRATIRDYGRQFGTMWAALLLIQLLIILIFRTANWWFAELPWPGGFEANFLVFLPFVQGFFALFIAIKAGEETRGFLLILVALTPWLYAGNLQALDYATVYEEVPTEFFNVSLAPQAAETKWPLVNDFSRFHLHPTGIALFPTVALFLAFLTPSLGVATVRRYFPKRPTLARLNLLGILGCLSFFGAIAVVAVLADESVEALIAQLASGFPIAGLLVAPAAIIGVHLVDWRMASTTTAALLRHTLRLLVVALVLYWLFVGAVAALEWFQENPRAVRVVELDIKTLHVAEEPDRRMMRSIAHGIALFVLLVANMGLVVTGIVDLVTQSVLGPRPPDPETAGLTRLMQALNQPHTPPDTPPAPAPESAEMPSAAAADDGGGADGAETARGSGNESSEVAP